ncbi:hypothetical protein, partial [Acinetobacter baumannii]|uniref:hypothetical protein n=1 Tax=Acinetobacter baumannii TaxID=470 RepID=UPI00366DA326
CREEFEKQRYWIGLFRTGVDFDVTLGEFGRYISNGTKSTDAMDLESFNEKWEAWANCWQHQQAKVEELQRRNQMLNDNIKEQGQKLVYQNEVIETQAEKLLGLRDEKAELQKRVDAVIIEIENMYLSGAIGFDTVKKLEQALKGDQYDEHCKKAEEVISKGASLTNHRIEL